MLRPIRDIWHVSELDSLRRQFADVRNGQEPCERRHRAAASVGAVGFIDSVALAMIDRYHEGRDMVLKRMAREYDDVLWHEEGVARGDRLSLCWQDGVIRAWGRLADGVMYFGDMIKIAPNTVFDDAIGANVEDYVAAPFIEGLMIIGVEPRYGEITIRERLIALDSNGKIIDEV